MAGTGQSPSVNIGDLLSITAFDQSSHSEFCVEKQSGVIFYVEVSASNVTSQTGKILGRMVSFVDITSRKKIEIDRDQLIRKLQQALEKIKTLSGIIPICACCKKIRDDKGYWHSVEVFVRDHSLADFSHGICPNCANEHYKDFLRVSK